MTPECPNFTHPDYKMTKISPGFVFLLIRKNHSGYTTVLIDISR